VRKGKKKTEYLMLFSIMLLMALSFTFTSCGGGGGGGGGGGVTPVPGTPIIFAELNSFPTGSVPPGFRNDVAFVSIVDSSNGSAIANATAIMNEVPLLYNGTYQDYEGNVAVPPGNPITLSITVNGTVYTASTTQYSSCPVILSPAPNATWSASNSNTVTWSGGAPTTPNGVYGLGVLDANNSNDNLVWPADNSFQIASIYSNSYTIPANSLTAGGRLLTVGIATMAPIPGAANGSGFVVAGFSYVPVTVTTTVSPTNVKAVPGNEQVTLSWDAVAGATSYNIYWSTTAANATMSAGTKIANVTSPFVHMGLTNDTTYYYVVTAVGPGGESQESLQVASAPVASVIPGAAVAAAFGNGQVTVSWTGVPGAISYNIYRSTTAANATMSAGTKIADVTSPYVDTGLTNGTAYYYLVTAVTNGGENPLSSPVAAKPGIVDTVGTAIAYQINSAHSGYATFGQPLTFPSSAAWSIKLGGAVSYPVIVGGRVFVMTAGSGTGGYGTQLYALDLATGTAVWGPIAIPGTYYWAGHTYDNGKIFVVNFDGLLQSFDAASGTAGWSVKLPDQYAFTSPPTAANGIVYVGGSGYGGTLYAVDENDGNILWMSSVTNGDHSSPAISNDGIFVSYPCQVYKFDLVDGLELWHYLGGCGGGGGKTPAYANGSLYVRDFEDFSLPTGKIFGWLTGNITGTFGPIGSMLPIPAFDSTAGYFLNGGTLQSENLSAQTVNWSFAGDGNLISAPIVIDQVVIIGSSTGNVYAVNAQNGSQLWVGAAGSSISAPDEQNVFQPLTGFSAGEGYLVVPAGDTITAWLLTGQ
jgi:outer membrane protein assembly factor BamB